jgi:transcriptional regulator of heat shock response
MINEDWEMENLKDFIYLHEEMQLLKQDINEEKERLAAKIFVIKEEKISEHEKHSISAIPRTT